MFQEDFTCLCCFDVFLRIHGKHNEKTHHLGEYLSGILFHPTEESHHQSLGYVFVVGVKVGYKMDTKKKPSIYQENIQKYQFFCKATGLLGFWGFLVDGNFHSNGWNFQVDISWNANDSIQDSSHQQDQDDYTPEV